MFGLTIGVHDRYDDLDAHLDILRFCPEPPFICIVNSNKQTPESNLIRWQHHDVRELNCYNFHIGPLIAFCHGLRSCSRQGCDYMIYRNADDWLFKHEMMLERLDHMRRNKYLIGGYNWFTFESMNDFAMNELTCHVPTLMELVDEMEQHFIHSSLDVFCELKIAKWIRKIGSFYRLPHREQSFGVGNDLAEITELGRLFDNNNRFFNKHWQLLGHHDNEKRGNDYFKIRHDIHYHGGLEKCESFERWLESWKNQLPWNSPNLSHQRKRTNQQKPTPRKITHFKKPLHK